MKKSSKANLEKKRIAFLGMGLIIASSIVLLSLTYKTAIISDVYIDKIDNINDLEDVQPIEYNTPLPIIPKVIQPRPIVIEEVKLVDNDKKVDVIELIDTSLIDLGYEDVDETDTIQKTVIYDVAPISPTYPGGAGEMTIYIQDNFIYPEIAKEMKESGTVWVEFIIHKNGSIKDVRIAKGVSNSLDKEAIRVVKGMSKWNPGIKDGKPVNVRLTIPIRLKLG